MINREQITRPMTVGELIEILKDENPDTVLEDIHKENITTIYDRQCYKTMRLTKELFPLKLGNFSRIDVIEYDGTIYRVDKQ